MSRSVTIAIRKGTAAAWTSANPILHAGEPGLETDTQKVKYGDGITPWVDLPYASGGGSQYALSNHSHGNPTLALTNLSGTTASASNGLTISLSASPGGGGADGVNILAAGTQTANSTGTVLFQNGNGLTFGMSNSSVITASHNGLTTQTVQPSLQSFSAGTTRITTGEVIFSNANGISFGVDGQTVTATVRTDYLTTAMASNRGSDFVQATAAFAGTNASGTIGSNGISVSVGPYITTARASTDAIGLNSALTANGVSMTANSSGLSLNFPAFLTTAAQSNHSHGNPSLALTNLSGTTASNSAGFTLSLSAGNYLTTARASTDAVGLNTAQSNVTWTVNSSGLSLDARGYAGTATGATNASVTVNSGGVSVSVGNYLTSQSNQALAGANGSFTFQTATFANSNGVSFSTGTQGLFATVKTDYAASDHSHGNPTLALTNLSGTTASASNGFTLSLSAAAPGGGGTTNQTGPNIAAGTQTATSGTVVFSNANGFTFGMSNSSVVTASYSSTRATLSGLVIAPFGGYAGPLHFAQSSASLGQNSLYIYPVQIEDYLTCDHIRMPVLVSNSSSAAASVQKGQTYRLAIYTRNATNATVLTRHYSTSYTIAASHNSNASWALSMITAIGNSTSYNSVTASSAGLNLSASLHGPREFIMPVSSLFPPGEYWFAVAASTSSVGAGGSVLQMSNLAVAHQTFNRPGLSTASSNSGWQQFMGAGIYSATTGAMPGGISLTQINQAGTFPVMFAATGTV